MSLTQDRGNNREPLHIHRLYQTLCKQLDNWRNRPPKTHFLATISMLSYIWINRKGIRTRYDALPGLDVDGLQLPHSRERPVGRHPEHRWKIFALAQLVVILTAVTFLSASHHYNQASNTGYCAFMPIPFQVGCYFSPFHHTMKRSQGRLSGIRRGSSTLDMLEIVLHILENPLQR